MLLRELFEDPMGMAPPGATPNTPPAPSAKNGSMGDKLQQSAMDLLVPMAGQQVPFVTVQQVIDQLRDLNTGVAVDRSTIMDLLNPDTTKIVKKIEGDRIYLQAPVSDADKGDAKDEAERQRDAQRIEDKAQKQAKKEIGR